SYTMTGFTDQGFAKPSFAMQFPDVTGTPVADFLDPFLRGNRDDNPRRTDGSILQALTLMNNSFVEARIQFSGNTPSPLIFQNITKSNPDLINILYLNILSRLPSADEMAKAQAALPTAA